MDDAATGTATLARDGRTIAETALAGCLLTTCLLTAALPSQQGQYTLTTSMRRQVPHTTLSSTVESAWTFTSEATSEAKPLPLFAVRYAPVGLDSFNRARPGTVTRVPIRVERNPGAPRAKVTSLSVEMSSDDGANWLALPGVPTGSGWTAAVPNPRTAGFPGSAGGRRVGFDRCHLDTTNASSTQYQLITPNRGGTPTANVSGGAIPLDFAVSVDLTGTAWMYWWLKNSGGHPRVFTKYEIDEQTPRGRPVQCLHEPRQRGTCGDRHSSPWRR